MDRKTFIFRKDSEISLVTFSILAAFTTYCSMYAFRKPLSAGIYESYELWGVEYKIILICSQVLGYMLSKFIGIKVISELKAESRINGILLLIGVSWMALLLFAIIPFPYNFILLFFNGLPLGMIWGIVFSFLEGRKQTELMGVGMSISFILASGLVKGVGRALVNNLGIHEFWMPFLTGMIFIPGLILGAWMLSRIPPPSREDEKLRTRRIPMNGRDRWNFFQEFATGIVLLIGGYVALTIFRDLRDNFAVEIWSALGYPDSPQILLTAEIPIAILVFIIIGSMVLIKNNGLAFFSNIGIVMGGGILMVLTTYLFQQGVLRPEFWMILVGFGTYLSYISYHAMLFERLIAFFQYPSNIGFLMYIADAFGYLGSTGILFYKNFGFANLDWLNFSLNLSYIVGGLTIIFSGFSWIYFSQKKRPELS